MLQTNISKALILLVSFILIGEVSYASPRTKTAKLICVGAVKSSIKQPLTMSEIEHEIDLVEKKEWDKHREATGFYGWVSQSIRFKKLLFRWLNGKHLNYSYLDDARVSGEIFANPKLNQRLTDFMKRRTDALGEIPEVHSRLLKEKSEKVAKELLARQTVAGIALGRFEGTAGGWWTGRLRIKETVAGIENYEKHIDKKITQGVLLRINERLLFSQIIRKVNRRQFPITVEIVREYNGELQLYQQPFLSGRELRSFWRGMRSKRLRIFRSFFSKGELGELEETYAAKWAELRSMQARLEHYEDRGELSKKSQKRLDQIRELNEDGLPHPSYTAERWLDLVMGSREARTFFFGTSTDALVQKIESTFPAVLTKSEREELVRELEIADLASFWGRTRSKLAYSLLFTLVPMALTSDGFVEGIKDYSTATINHIQQWSQSYLNINEVVAKDSLISRVESKLVSQEIKFLELAQMPISSEFASEATAYIESVLSKPLDSQERVLVYVMLQGGKGGVKEPSFSLLANDRVRTLVSTILMEQADLKEKKRQLGDDFPKYLRDRFEERMALRLLKIQ